MLIIFQLSLRIPENNVFLNTMFNYRKMNTPEWKDNKFACMVTNTMVSLKILSRFGLEALIMLLCYSFLI